MIKKIKNKISMLLLLSCSFILITGCKTSSNWILPNYDNFTQNNDQPPEPWKAIPTKVQLDWHDLEYYGIIHYGLNTYIEQEWGYGNISPQIFNPSNLNTDQWVQICKQAGMKGIIFVAKHHDGFCLWQTETTNYSLKASPWKNGKGDIVSDLATSCKKYNLKLGIYISPWDRNHSDYGQDKYVKDYHKQWEELLTLYGDQLFEVWFDGANGGDGWYGGADTTRSIPNGYYQYDKLFQKIYKLAPNAVIFGGDGINCIRWGGNESGYVDKTNWSRFTRNSDDIITDLTIFEKGMEEGLFWLPAESDVPLKHLWFYHSNSPFKTIDEMLDDYYESIGRNSSLNYGIAIGPDGLIPEKDSNLLLALKQQLDKDFSVDLAEKASFSANIQRGKHFAPSNCKIYSREKYWSTPEGVSNAVLQLNFDEQVEFNRLLLCEPIQLGQRINQFEVQIQKKSGYWKTIAKETTIGAKRILRLKNNKTKAIRIFFSTKAPEIAVSRISIYNAPKYKKKSFLIKQTKTEKMINNSSLSIFDIKKDKSIPVKKSIFFEMFDNNLHSMTEIDLKRKSIIIDMGQEKNIVAISYTPRQDNSSLGTVYKYQLHYSSNGSNWRLLKEGHFNNVKNNPIQQKISFNEQKCRFLKFTPTTTLENLNTFSCSEFSIFEKLY